MFRGWPEFEVEITEEGEQFAVLWPRVFIADELAIRAPRDLDGRTNEGFVEWLNDHEIRLSFANGSCEYREKLRYEEGPWIVWEAKGE